MMGDVGCTRCFGVEMVDSKWILHATLWMKVFEDKVCPLLVADFQFGPTFALTCVFVAQAKMEATYFFIMM